MALAPPSRPRPSSSSFRLRGRLAVERASLPPSPSVPPVERASLARPTLRACQGLGCGYGGQVARPTFSERQHQANRYGGQAVLERVGCGGLHGFDEIRRKSFVTRVLVPSGKNRYNRGRSPKTTITTRTIKMTTPLPTRRRTRRTNRISQPKGRPFFSLNLIQSLIVLLIGLAIPPASRAEIVTDAGSSVVQTIPIAAPGGNGVGGLAISPNGKNVYVAVSEGDAIAVIDTATHQISSFIETASNPLGVVVSPDGTTLYVTEGDNNLEVFSLPTNELLFTVPVGSGPQIPGVSPDGTMVYVACTDGTITTIDYDTGIVSSIAVGGEPFQVVFNAAGTEAYACNAQNSYISVIDTATAAVTQITTPNPTIGLVIDGTKLYATSFSEVLLINTTTETVAATIPVPNPTGAALAVPALTPDGKYLYAGVLEIVGPPVTPGESLIVIDTKTKKVEGQPIPVGVGPVQIVTAPNGKLGYLSNEISGTVSVIKLLK